MRGLSASDGARHFSTSIAPSVPRESKEKQSDLKRERKRWLSDVGSISCWRDVDASDRERRGALVETLERLPDRRREESTSRLADCLACTDC